MEAKENLQGEPEPTNYNPHEPTPKQRDFLDLTCDEAFYGGAAGGGKSDALLMWALEGANIPGYAAIIFRRTFPQLSQPGGLISRSHEWLAGTDAHWNGSEKQWTFPSGAVLRFGHLQHEVSKYDYQGGEYIRACFDELTHFTETQYTYIMSRLRRVKGFPICPGVRAASNPGGQGHYWVKSRFVSEEAIHSLNQGIGGTFWVDGRAFVPARIADNPYLDEAEYMQKLSHLPPVTRMRLAKGDWSVIEDSIIKADWFRYYKTRQQILQPLRVDGSHITEGIDDRECRRFMVVDTAGTSEDKKREKRGKPPSFSVCSVWDYWSDPRYLFLRHIWRGRVEFIELCEAIIHSQKQWEVPQVYIENAHHGKAVRNLLASQMNIDLVSPHEGLSRSGQPGKVERSWALQNMLSEGRVFFPQTNNDWLVAYEQELLAWTGHEDDIWDQGDTSSYAAMLCQTEANQVMSADMMGGISQGIPSLLSR